MNIKKFTITEECIGCMACVGISDDIFAMNDDGKAFVVRQPENADEEQQAEEAAGVCPVDAIIPLDTEVKDDKKPVLASDNVKEILDKYPDLREVLLKLSPKFKRLQNPVMYNTLAKFTSFKEAASLTGVSLCEILHTINKYLGTEDKLFKAMPECIRAKEQTAAMSEEISWDEAPERYILTDDTADFLIEKIMRLQPQESIVIISVKDPGILVKTAEANGFKYNLQKGREYRLSVFNPQAGHEIPWKDRKDDFEVLDVRFMKTDPFDIIIKKAYELQEGQGFVLVQTFEPFPIIKMLNELGFEHETEKTSASEVKVYFYKSRTDKEERGITVLHKPEIVLQSATPVAYPVLMRLLQSDRLRSAVKIKELKVWSETEKHLGWIVNKKADISFSAVITSNKLRNADIKFPAVFVWDNFVILTRGYTAKSLADLRYKNIYLPLFADAPPAKITRYLIKASGLSPEEFTFKYGTPFGRPEKIYADLVLGKIDTAVLREPEASYAVKIMQDQGVEFSEIKFDDLWNGVNPGFGSFPNAGIVFKGDFVRNYPDLTELVLEELENSIDWVKNNRDEAANLSFDIMRQPADRVQLFLERVTFSYMSGDALRDKVKRYFEVLIREDIVQAELSDEFLNMFSL